MYDNGDNKDVGGPPLDVYYIIPDKNEDNVGAGSCFWDM